MNTSKPKKQEAQGRPWTGKLCVAGFFSEEIEGKSGLGDKELSCAR